MTITHSPWYRINQARGKALSATRAAHKQVRPTTDPGMSRRVYLFLVCLRLYFALSPSYIHPDEHFQGPEIIAGIISQVRLPSLAQV